MNCIIRFIWPRNDKCKTIQLGNWENQQSYKCTKQQMKNKYNIKQQTTTTELKAPK